MAPPTIMHTGEGGRDACVGPQTTIRRLHFPQVFLRPTFPILPPRPAPLLIRPSLLFACCCYPPPCSFASSFLSWTRTPFAHAHLPVAQARSTTLHGVISPYPIVVRVIIAQYSEVKYCVIGPCRRERGAGERVVCVLCVCVCVCVCVCKYGQRYKAEEGM